MGCCVGKAVHAKVRSGVCGGGSPRRLDLNHGRRGEHVPPSFSVLG